MLRFNDNSSSDQIGNPSVGSAFYFWKIKMATDENLAGNEMNNHNRKWWRKECERIESIPRKFKPKVVK